MKLKNDNIDDVLLGTSSIDTMSASWLHFRLLNDMASASASSNSVGINSLTIGLLEIVKQCGIRLQLLSPPY